MNKQSIFTAVLILILALLALLLVKWIDIPSETPHKPTEQALDSTISINMEILALIESSGNTEAFNANSQARGLYQIREIAWQDVHNHYPELKKYTYMEYVYNKNISTLFAKKYFNILAKYLKSYNYPVNTENLLLAYNMGIGNFIEDKMPKESLDYVKKYYNLIDK